jgi:hypothetical protein
MEVYKTLSPLDLSNPAHRYPSGLIVLKKKWVRAESRRDDPSGNEGMVSTSDPTQGDGARTFRLDRICVHANTSRMPLTPKALQDLIDELEASRASRKRAWEVLQEIPRKEKAVSPDILRECGSEMSDVIGN